MGCFSLINQENLFSTTTNDNRNRGRTEISISAFLLIVLFVVIRKLARPSARKYPKIEKKTRNLALSGYRHWDAFFVLF
jgi:hypothetical protein